MQGSTMITIIKQVCGRVFERMLSENGIEAFNGAQGNILRVLWQEDGLPIRDLSRRTGLAMASLTGMLDRMETADLIRRDRGDTDRRKVLIFLTDHAKSLEADFLSVQEQFDAVLYSGFSEEEVQQFETYLSRVQKNVEGALYQN